MAKLISEELYLIRFEMEEMQTFPYDIGIRLIRQDKVEQSDNIKRNCKDVVQTMSDLMVPFSDCMDGSLASNDGFAVEDVKRNDNALIKREEVSASFAVKLHTAGCVVDTDEMVLDNTSFTTAFKKKDDFVNGEIGDLIKEKTEHPSFNFDCATLEPSSSLPSDLCSVVQCNPHNSAYMYLQSNNETSTKARLIQFEDHQVSEKRNKQNETVKDCSTTRSSTNSRLDTNKNKRGRTPEKNTISTLSKLPEKCLPVHACQFCSKSFKGLTGFAWHRPTHTGEKPYECDVCSKRFQVNSALKRHMRIHSDDRPYKCDVCPKRYKASSALKQHMIIHTGEGPYECDICSKRFLVNSALKKHMITHTDERPYECDICSKRFKRDSQLALHMIVHTGERPYKCDVCLKRFQVNSALKKHMVTHTDERPFECDTCSKQFKRNSQLVLHMRIHTDERPYKCDTCSKQFKRSSQLVLHVRTHTGERPYKCHMCSKRFHDDSALKKHVRVHTGERPYKCDICLKLFKQSSALKNHMRIHTGEKPYMCHICSKRFKRNSTLKQHIKMHAGERP